eukprot:1161350-Pelagomonas_calceolata.AAC.18
MQPGACGSKYTVRAAWCFWQCPTAYKTRGCEQRGKKSGTHMLTCVLPGTCGDTMLTCVQPVACGRTPPHMLTSVQPGAYSTALVAVLCSPVCYPVLVAVLHRIQEAGEE